MNNSCYRNMWCANDTVGAGMIPGACDKKNTNIEHYTSLSPSGNRVILEDVQKRHDCLEKNSEANITWAANSHYMTDTDSNGTTWLDRNKNASTNDIIAYVHQQADRSDGNIKSCTDVNKVSKKEETRRKMCQEATDRKWNGYGKVMFNPYFRYECDNPANAGPANEDIRTTYCPWPGVTDVSDADNNITNPCMARRLLYDDVTTTKNINKSMKGINFCFWDDTLKTPECQSSTYDETKVNKNCQVFPTDTDMFKNVYDEALGVNDNNIADTMIEVQTYAWSDYKQILALKPSSPASGPRPPSEPSAASEQYGRCIPPNLTDDCVQYMNNDFFKNGDRMSLKQFREMCLDAYNEDKCGTAPSATFTYTTDPDPAPAAPSAPTPTPTPAPPAPSAPASTFHLKAISCGEYIPHTDDSW